MASIRKVAGLVGPADYAAWQRYLAGFLDAALGTNAPRMRPSKPKGGRGAKHGPALPAFAPRAKHG